MKMFKRILLLLFILACLVIPVTPVFADDSNGNPLNPVTSFMLYNFTTGVYQDLTTLASNISSNDTPLFPNNFGNGDCDFIGYTTKFNVIQIYISTPGVGAYQIEANYYNGSSFVPLDIGNDISNGFTAQSGGIVQLSFSDPSDWQETAINSNQTDASYCTAYYIQIEITGFASETKVPIASQILVLNTNTISNVGIGSMTESGFDGLSNAFHINFKAISLFILFFIVGGMVFSLSGNLSTSIIISLPIFVLGVITGFVSISFLIIIIFMCILLLGYYLFLRFA